MVLLLAVLPAGCSGGGEAGGTEGAGDTGDGGVPGVADGVGGAGGADGADSVDEGGDPAEAADPENGSGGYGPGGADTLAGATDELLQRAIDEAGAALAGAEGLPQIVMEPVTFENAPVMLGLIPDDFVEYVEDASVAQSLTSPPAFRVALIKSQDAQSALIVNEQIKNNFDSGQWVSIMPERSLTVVSGSWVFLAVGLAAQTEALADAFASLAGGNVSPPEIFYTGETGGDISEPVV